MSWNNCGPYPPKADGALPPTSYPGDPLLSGSTKANYPPQPPPYEQLPQSHQEAEPYSPFPGALLPTAPSYPVAPPYPGAGGYSPLTLPYGVAPYSQLPQSAAQGGNGGVVYAEDPEVKRFDFSDKSIRRGFIRKVYYVLMCQLGISTAFIAWFLYDRETRMFVQRNPWLLIVALIFAFVSLIVMACCSKLRRQAPMNFIFLAVFTVAMAFLLAVGSSAYRVEGVLMAAGITAAVCLALTLFAFQTQFDFTMCGGILFVVVVILFIFGMVAIFVHSKIVQMVYASLGALIFSIYLVCDTQRMIGGKHKYSISSEEYIFAVSNLYVDIISIFVDILKDMSD